MTTSCFEFWLLLHVANLESFGEDEKISWLNHRKGKGGKSNLELTLGQIFKEYGLGNYHKNQIPENIVDGIPRAVKQAFQHQLDDYHWQEKDFATLLHILLQRIFKLKSPEFTIPED